MKSLSRVRLFATPWTLAYQDPQSMGFSRQEYWSGLPFPSPGDLPDPGFEPGSPALQADTLPSEPPGSPALSKRSSCWKARKLWKHRESFQQPRAILTAAFHWEAGQSTVSPVNLASHSVLSRMYS